VAVSCVPAAPRADSAVAFRTVLNPSALSLPAGRLRLPHHGAARHAGRRVRRLAGRHRGRRNLPSDTLAS
jgi:hypothetical protein